MDRIDRKAIGEKIRIISKFKGWDQQRLAEETGITLHEVQNLQQGNPVDQELDKIFKIAISLSISFDYLFGYHIGCYYRHGALMSSK